MRQNQPLTQSLITRIRDLSTPLSPEPTSVRPHLRPLPNVKAVVFDVYGTLFVSGTGDISIARAMSNDQAVSEALRQAGFSGNLEEAGKQGLACLLESIQQTHTARKAAGIACPEVDIREEWERVLSHLLSAGLIQGQRSSDATLRVSVEYECRVNPVWPMPDLAALLAALRQRRVCLGIVSNAQFYTPLLFPAFLNQSHKNLGFDPHLCAWSFEQQEAKPSVNLFIPLIKQLQRQGISPDEALYVGNDMLNDIWPATQLGLKTALFAGDQRSLRQRSADPRCSSLEPDLILTALSQLLETL